MRHRTSTTENVVALTLLLAFSCARTTGGAQAPEPEPAPATSTTHAGMHGHGMHGQGAHQHDTCPMADAEVQVTDTENGVALAYETEEDVEHLRRHVERMAGKIRMHGSVGAPMHRHGGSPHASGPASSPMAASPQGDGAPVAEVTVENSDRGARIVLVPASPEDLERLRQWAREHGAHMQNAPCRGHSTAKHAH